MFSPQKLWALTPRSERGQKSGSVSGSGLNPSSKSPRSGGDSFSRGKALAILDTDGPLDQDSLIQRVSKIENELFEYQYNMGLLLIEKKEWTSKYEELGQALADTAEALKREEAAHSNAMSELEKREENLKKALGVEKQCVHDLEKALHEMRAEHAEIKFNADSKLAEANLLVTSVEEKALEVEAKFHAADAKLAEVSRKSSEIERKWHELEAQENSLRRERSLFTTERKRLDSAIAEQKEDLRERERKLQEAEERLADSRRLLNQREERANDFDKTFKEKQNELEELRNKIEMDSLALNSKEDDMRNRLASVVRKEQEAVDLRKSLEVKERQLQEFEDSLNTREKLEVQKLLEEHETLLAVKTQEFELEMDQKRKLHDEQLKDKEVEVQKREVEIAHKEEKVNKREQAIKKKSEEVKEKEMGLVAKSNALKEREKSLNVEKKSLEDDRKQILADTEELLVLKAELDHLRAETEKQQVRLNEEREQLKVTEEERLELERLQSELKKEIDKYRSQSEQLMKDVDELKQEREKFEKEWEDLDDKRAQTKKEQEDVLEQKQYIETIAQAEKERLEKEKAETQEYVRRELETLKLEKESFAASMEHEKSITAENYQNEKSQLLHEFEQRKQELETEVRKRQEELESRLREREKSFEEERERELSNINYLREVARREMEEMKVERRGIEKERQEMLENKNHVEAQQSEMKKDIEELVGLSQKLKDQREEFIKERDRFIAFAENQKSCNICGEKIREFMLSDLNPLSALTKFEAPPLPKAAEDYMKQADSGTSKKIHDELSPVFNIGSSGGTISWLRKCTTKILKLSPGKKLELDSASEQIEASALPAEQVIAESSKAIQSGVNDPEPSLQVANELFDVQAPSDGPLEIPEDSQNSKRLRQNGSRKGVARPRAVRTRKMKEVTDGAKTFLGESPEDRDNQYANGDAENSAYTNDSRADSALGTPTNRRKRNRITVSQATASENQSEGPSDSVKDNDRPKRRQRISTTDQNVVQNRYNLRRPKKSTAAVADASLPKGRNGKAKEADQQPELNPSQNVEDGEDQQPEFNPSQNVEDGEIQEHEAQTELARDDRVRSMEAASAFSADSSPARVKYVGETFSEQVYTENASVMALSDDEVTGTVVINEGYKTESRGEDDDGDDGDDDDDGDHPGQASVGKKLWTFLTT